MRLRYGGKYNGDESSLPQRAHPPGAVPFRESDDVKKVSLVANVGCALVMLLLAIPFLLLGMKYIPDHPMRLALGGVLGGLSLLPHELLHAACYRGDVCLYHDFAHGLMFVVGTEDMSKVRFILMCLCPNILLGIIPYVAFLLFPRLIGLGLFGIVCVGMGFGDWINVYNAVRQMPKGARTYLCGMHSYWYTPDRR